MQHAHNNYVGFTQYGFQTTMYESKLFLGSVEWNSSPL